MSLEVLQPPCPMTEHDALFRASNVAILNKVGNVTPPLIVRVIVVGGELKLRSALNEHQDPAGHGGIHRRNCLCCICSIVVIALVFHVAGCDAIKRLVRHALHGQGDRPA